MTARSRWRRYFFDRFKRPVRHFFDRFKHPGRHFLARSKMKAQRRAERRSKYAALKKLGELPPKAGGTASPNAGGIPPPSPFSTDYKDFLLEAYKKHSTELASIEDRLNKLLLIILGVFGAGATAISKATLEPWTACMLVFLVIVFAGFGLHYVLEIHQVRAEVRYLLVRCEIEMGFYISNDRSKEIHRANKQLYTDDEFLYPTKGEFLTGTYAAVILLAALGLTVLILQAAGRTNKPLKQGSPSSAFAPF